ncbi:hypothetical protein BGZ80_003991 [Entomortierella chlamydospora]|uniref:Uncharacterized protein n=1 Tax=Entomortierella chlamydospora TaxID=101097 RepID=A0A9P6SW60_9FUNG|nr:hypothetical protein BGZ80_003991 [Entomortierella chlamydospora]
MSESVSDPAAASTGSTTPSASETTTPTVTTASVMSNTLPGMPATVIGNGPGYENGEPIALPILPMFNKKLPRTNGKLHRSAPASPITPSSDLGQWDRNGQQLVPNGDGQPKKLADAAHIPSAAHSQSHEAPATPTASANGFATVVSASASVSSVSGSGVTATTTTKTAAAATTTTTTTTTSATASPTSRACSTRDGADAGILVFSGGTACNSLVHILQEMTPNVTYHIPSDKKEVIRGFLIYIQSEILKRAHKRFSFANGSIGNFFLTGARMFFGSLESAIFLFAAITGVTEPTRVLPVINTNHGIAIAALLKNGNTILGQCAISHPSSDKAMNTETKQNASKFISHDELTSPEYATLLSSSQQQEDSFSTLKLVENNIHFDKSPTRASSLQSRITRLYYINEYGQEIFPPPNPKLICSLTQMETLIYSIGSLYTSIIPCLILKDVGRCIAESRSLKNKIFMLNGTNDRETPDYTALDFIWALTSALNYSLKLSGQFWPTEHKPSKYITHLLYLDNSEVQVDTWGIEKLGIECVPCVGRKDSPSSGPIYDEEQLNKTLESILDGTWSSSIAGFTSSSSTTANSTRPSSPTPVATPLASKRDVASSLSTSTIDIGV